MNLTTMAESPYISVIVPIYNAEKYLREAIESVINQTYQNWELILVNDGSTDSSPEICDEYARKDTRICCINTTGQGVCYARNNGIENSRGEYIFFMDADDILTVDCLLFLIKQFERQNVDIVSGNSMSFNEIKQYPPCKLHKNDIANSIEMLNDVLFGRTIGSIWGKLYRKEAIGRVRFANGLKLGEDINFLTRLLLTNRTLKIFRTNKVVYNYRLVNTSISHSKTNGLEKVKSYIDEMIRLYNEFENDINSLCGSAYAKNLCGSVFVYLRMQPFMNKNVDNTIAETVMSLKPFSVPHHKKPIEILLSRSKYKLNMYFSYDQIRTQIKYYGAYRKSLLRKLSNLIRSVK